MSIKSPVTPISLQKIHGDESTQAADLLVTEEPLEIRLKYAKGGNMQEQRLAVTMRTPGHDFELAVGFLITESIIDAYSDIEKLFYCEDVRSEEEEGNVIIVVLKPEVEIDDAIFKRNFYVTSSCGVCGKSSIESVRVHCDIEMNDNSPVVNRDLIAQIPDLVRQHQSVFKHTGGLHASALLDKDGKMLILREDVGRHNALDKLVGARAILDAENAESILFVSGRVSFELVQKAYVANIRIIAAVGAPSSLAISMAKECGMTVAGFVRDGKFNIYCGDKRLYA